MGSRVFARFPSKLLANKTCPTAFYEIYDVNRDMRRNHSSHNSPLLVPLWESLELEAWQLGCYFLVLIKRVMCAPVLHLHYVRPVDGTRCFTSRSTRAVGQVAVSRALVTSIDSNVRLLCVVLVIAVQPTRLDPIKSKL